MALPLWVLVLSLRMVEDMAAVLNTAALSGGGVVRTAAAAERQRSEPRAFNIIIMLRRTRGAETRPQKAQAVRVLAWPVGVSVWSED